MKVLEWWWEYKNEEGDKIIESLGEHWKKLVRAKGIFINEARDSYVQ